jgi:hypothetical protein
MFVSRAHPGQLVTDALLSGVITVSKLPLMYEAEQSHNHPISSLGTNLSCFDLINA